ncbi:non-lysosomal glucosylceramidase-like [Penaeus monodon]|uniref:non-lysosomal glucosylceramidase-like n=1 Tax=Penaeus monodon TaxID=6687 RepID=UPI0018A7876D|nr:non-lysosomal glucosylceramidase-like [Penaeus monodon]
MAACEEEVLLSVRGEGVERKLENVSRFPRHGWKVPLDHRFPEKRNQRIRPRIAQLPQLMPLFVRYLVYYMYTRAQGRKPWIDCITMMNGKQMYGVPLGGIGSGTIGRGFRGEFCRYQMVPGIYEYHTVMANQFIVTIRDPKGNTLYQKVLSVHSKSKKGLGSWDWGFSGADALYCGLYPRSWTVYNIKEQSIRLICRQISPVIPHNYKDSCLPVGMFVWNIENHNSEPRDVSISLTFKNGTGSSEDKNGECWSEVWERDLEEGKAKGVVLHQTIKSLNLRYCLAVREKPGVSASHCPGFDPTGPGDSVWNDLKMDGELESKEAPLIKTRKGEERAVAVCGKCSIGANKSGMVEIALAWDMPQIVFKSRGITHTRRYTRWFGDEQTAAQEIASYALDSYKRWEVEIENWQNPILQDKDLPDWFKSAIFNELYFISDGGSVWLEMTPSPNTPLPAYDTRPEYGRFAYLESHEYRMYNTYDVHFYASWALVMLWPELQKSLQYDMAQWTTSADLTPRTHLFRGNKGVRKLANAVPHDIGDPEDEPFVRVNAYQIHDISYWKDLNLKFVLQVYRDHTFFRDLDHLTHMWPVCRAVMDRCFAYDRDGDGLIENEGQADQTYDSWVMHGPSAYCCSLWVAALAVMVEMASELKDEAEEKKFAEALAKARVALQEKLWNGKYYKFDCCDAPHSHSIMADQLVGHWYLSLSGAAVEVFRRDCVKSVLELLYEYNVQRFNNGEMGAVNGMNPDGSIDRYTMQSEEMWVGVTYGLAATMIYEGMVEQGFKTAEGVYRTVYEKIGQGFETPEALYGEHKYRAIGYMRPLSIWSMYHAYLQQKRRKMAEACQKSYSNTSSPVPSMGSEEGVNLVLDSSSDVSK